jgi:hypothetical protein
LDRLRRLAQRELDKVLSWEMLVHLPDGTARSALEFTDWYLLSTGMLPTTRSAISQWRIRRMAAEKGFVYIGDGRLKHIDSLTREDLQPLCDTIDARHDEAEAYEELEDFLIYALKDLEKLGVDVDWNQSLADWLETGLR